MAYAIAAAVVLASSNSFAYANSHANKTTSAHHQSLPDFLSDDKMTTAFPWGEKTAANTNYYNTTPITGVTRQYDWTVSHGSCAPDGVELDCVLVNNQFPGPTIEANWGDWIQVKVTNNLTSDGTSLHWHGMLQKQTSWMDGTPGIAQCPIAPGSDFTYLFQADLYGTSWWHSHYSSQYASGLMGPMIIYGPKNADYDVDLGPIMVSDWYHKYYQDVVDALLAPLPARNIPKSDNNLINGMNSFDCSETSLPCTEDAPLASFNFTSGKTHRMRFINPSAAAVQKITLDGHKFTVIANDMVPIVPYETDVLTLAVGQRTDVIVNATGAPTDAYWLRTYKPSICWPSNGGDEGKAAIYYEDANREALPISPPGSNAYNKYCGNDPLSQTVPYYAIAPGEPAVTEVMPLDFKSNGSNLLWYMSDRTFRADYNDPMLLESKLGNLNFTEIQNVHNYGSNSSLRFIVENTGRQPHPMHLHGHNIFILAQGSCTSNGKAATYVQDETAAGNASSTKRDLDIDTGTINKRRAKNEFGNCWDGVITNPTNPARRDVHMLLAKEYIVVQWNQDNPGVWPFHCHIAWHLSAGFSWMVLEQPDAIKNETNIPDISAQTCRDWSKWSGVNVVKQIDDGL